MTNLEQPWYNPACVLLYRPAELDTTTGPYPPFGTIKLCQQIAQGMLHATKQNGSEATSEFGQKLPSTVECCKLPKFSNELSIFRRASTYSGDD